MVILLKCDIHNIEYISDDNETTKCMECIIDGGYKINTKIKFSTIIKTKNTCKIKEIFCLNFHKYENRDTVHKGNRNRRYFWFICLSCHYDNEKINIDVINNSWKNNKKICTNRKCEF